MTRWYMVLRAYPWESIIVDGEPLRADPEPGEPDRMVPLFSTREAAVAWGLPDDEILEVTMGKDVA